MPSQSPAPSNAPKNAALTSVTLHGSVERFTQQMSDVGDALAGRTGVSFADGCRLLTEALTSLERAVAARDSDVRDNYFNFWHAINNVRVLLAYSPPPGRVTSAVDKRLLKRAIGALNQADRDLSELAEEPSPHDRSFTREFRAIGTRLDYQLESGAITSRRRVMQDITLKLDQLDASAKAGDPQLFAERVNVSTAINLLAMAVIPGRKNDSEALKREGLALARRIDRSKGFLARMEPRAAT